MMGLSFENWRRDVPAGLVVFLVAVPLCLGIALASGAPLFSGIIAGIVGGIVVTMFSGSPLGVSGPAAGLAVIVLTAIESLGDFRVFLMAVVIGGVIQVILGVARAGIIAYYFPSSVIKGMLAAIGIILILKQLPHAVGYDADYVGDMKFSQADGHNTISELFYMFEAFSWGPMAVAAVSLAILILWEQPRMKAIKALNLIQGPLVAVAAGIGLGYLFDSVGGAFAIDPAHMVALPVTESLQDLGALVTFPDFSAITNLEVWKVGITIAIVASIETLLCVEATDKLDPEKRVTPSNQELRAQGIGNIVAGLVGGIPVTQVIVRSSANINSGAKSKLSALVHGVFILIAVLIFPKLMNRIPLACLAAVLLVVGSKLARISLFRAMYKKGIPQFMPFMVTVLFIVFTDLLFGIGVGMAVAIFFVLLSNYRLPFHMESRKDDEGRDVYEIVLSEEVSFLNRGRIMKTLNTVPSGSHVIIDRSRTVTMDPDVQDVLDDYKAHAKTIDVVLEVREYPDPIFDRGTEPSAIGETSAEQLSVA